MNQQKIHQFKKIVWDFYAQNKRSFPWRLKKTTPYHIVVSEIMLQQTQADRVVPKFRSFITTFPSWKSLATTSQAEVLKKWQGLGYNRRARQLHQLAQIITTEYHGKLPQSIDALKKLPGIGPYTSSAIRVFAFNKPEIVIETNIRTVYIHHFFTKKSNIHDTELIPYIEQTMDTNNPKEWYAALMDYGTFLKKQYPNPSRKSKHYTKQSTFSGSNRQARGLIIKILTKNQNMSEQELFQLTKLDYNRFSIALAGLQKDKIIAFSADTWHLA